VSRRLSPARVGSLLGVLVGVSGMGTAAVAVALPDLASSLDVTRSHATWVVSAYAISMAVSTAMYGRLADSAGVRTPMLIGGALSVAGALFAAMAPSFALLILARVVQGAGAGAAPVLALAFVRVTYDAPSTRSRVRGQIIGVAVGISALGPALGGLLTQAFGWRGAVVAPAVGLVALLALRNALPRGGTGSPLDYVGAALVGGTACGALLLIQSPSVGAGALVLGCCLVLVVLPGLVVWVRRHPDGFLPHAVLGDPVVLRSALGTAVIPGTWYALLVLIPAVLTAAGWSPLTIGLALLPGAFMGVVVSLRAGWIVERLGPMVTIRLAATTCVVAALIAITGAGSAHWLLLVAMTLVYKAFGVGQPAMSAAIAESVSAELDGVALGIATLVFLVGAASGSAVASLSVVMGDRIMLLVLASLAAMGVAATYRSEPTPGEPPDRRTAC
jgi:MFS family permease